MVLDSGISIRIEGAEEGAGRVGASSKRAIDALFRVTTDRSNKLVNRLKQEMAREYKSKWHTGRLAAGIIPNVTKVEDGVDVNITIPDYRELEFVTSSLGGYFDHYPVTPFEIVPVEAKVLTIPLPVGSPLARFFIRNKKTGQFRGSRPGSPKSGGTVRVKRVLWGHRTGGFHRDVITEVTEEESERFVEDVQKAVKFTIEQI